MRSVGIKVLKNRLSEYVRFAAAGETVLITDRDKVVAELSPPQASRGERVTDVVLADLVRKGLMRPALRPPGTVPPRDPVAPFEEIMDDLRRSREDRW